MIAKLRWLKILACVAILSSYLWFKPQDQDFMLLHLTLTFVVAWVAVLLHDWMIPRIELNNLQDKLGIEVTITAAFCRTINRIVEDLNVKDGALNLFYELLKLIPEKEQVLQTHLRGLSPNACDFIYCHFYEENRKLSLRLNEVQESLTGREKDGIDDQQKILQRILSDLDIRRKAQA